MLLMVIIGGSLAILTWVFDSEQYLLWYPVGLNVAFFVIFMFSILYPPTVIEQLARVVNNNLPDAAISYTRKVTMVWTAFFVVNSMIAAWTALHGDMKIWTLYNGLISYLIVGLIFGIELLIRRSIKK